MTALDPDFRRDERGEGGGWIRRVLLGALASAALAACGPQPGPAASSGAPAPPKAALVYAASSLTEVMKELGAAYAATGQPKPDFSFAASSELARKIEQGAEADVFLSADEQWMDYLAGKNLIDAGSRVSLLGNTLVLVAPVDNLPKDLGPVIGEPNKPEATDPKAKELDRRAASILWDVKLRKLMGTSGKLVMGDPEAVPAGRYGKESLEALGVWGYANGHLAKASNVRDALRLVEAGEAAAGIVYATDVGVASDKVVLVGAFPEWSHKPIVYPMALTAGRTNGAAFAAYLKGDAAKAVFEKYGFRVLR